MSSEETAKLIAALSDRPLLEAGAQAELLDRAGGNPLYAEQYVRMLAERGTTVELPESVQGIIAARLDGLPPEEKAALQDAAVLGKVFWLGALGVSEERLHALQQKEFVQRARRSSVAGETEFAFKHVLVRDVAYGQIPRAERAEKHVRVAEWIESLGRSEDHAEMVAHHYSNALELARAAGQDTGDLVVHTRTALREAGEHALTLNALAQAEEYFRRALALIEPDDPERLRLLLQYGRVRYLRDLAGVDEIMEAREGLSEAGDRDGAAEASLMLADIEWQGGSREGMLKELEAARRLVDGASRSRTQVAVLAEVARYEMLADRLEAAIELGREALALAEELGLEDLRSHALNTIGVARADMGDRGGFDDLEASIEIATRGNFVTDLLRGHNNRQALYFLYGGAQEGPCGRGGDTRAGPPLRPAGVHTLHRGRPCGGEPLSAG